MNRLMAPGAESTREGSEEIACAAALLIVPVTGRNPATARLVINRFRSDHH